MRKFLKLLRSKKLEFVKREPAGQNAYTFYFKNEGIRYEAGQHFIFRLPHEDQDDRGAMRIFSISSAPSDELISITTRYFGEESSSFKKALMNMQPGEKIEVRGPSPLMDVYRIKDISIPLVFIAGGIGITPFKSVIDDAVENSLPLRGVLFYINRDKDFIFGEHIKDQVSKLADFEVIDIVSPAKLTFDRVKELESKIDLSGVDFRISGTVDFVDYYTDLLSNNGVSKRRIKAYRYRGLKGGY